MSHSALTGNQVLSEAADLITALFKSNGNGFTSIFLETLMPTISHVLLFSRHAHTRTLAKARMRVRSDGGVGRRAWGPH